MVAPLLFPHFVFPPHWSLGDHFACLKVSLLKGCPWCFLSPGVPFHFLMLLLRPPFDFFE